MSRQHPARLLLVPLTLAIVATGASAQAVSHHSLEKATTYLHEQVGAGRIAGGAHLVVQGGEVVHFEVAGVSDIEAKTPLRADTVMRIYSMTKPITSVAAMTLWEQNKFRLDDPVAKYIPAFEKTVVLVKQGDSYTVEPAKRKLTVRDLFRHTSGYSYGKDHEEIRKYYEREGMLYRPPHAMLPPEMTIADAAEALARIPALHHPGERFTYGFNTDLLGRLIEVWSGQTLADYMHEAIFEPLEMVDTGFAVTEQQKSRFASCHAWEEEQLVVVDRAGESPFNTGFKFASGGGGLVSTMQDYANFCRMLLNRGHFKGRQLLAPETIELMFTDQLNGAAGDFRFGLGFAIAEINLGSGDQQRKAKTYYWGGYANTAFRLVPQADLFQIFMRQTVPSTHRVANHLFSVVYEGVESSAVLPPTEGN